MTMTREEVENAALWDCEICLTCKAPVDAVEGYFCPHCSAPTLLATLVLQCLEVVEPASD